MKKEFIPEMAWNSHYMEKFNKIDKRKKYILVVDVETAGSTTKPLVYDIGYAVMDKKGNIYKSKSYVVKEIFFDEREKYSNPELMDTAYYADKLPDYFLGIREGKWQVDSIWKIRREIKELISTYNIQTVAAYNAAFDRNALNNTVRYIAERQGITCNWFFPYGLDFWCIWNIACQTLLLQKSYFKMADGEMWISSKGNVQTSAEKTFAYMTGQRFFEEEHTGLKDVLIECQILARCLKVHKKLEHGKGIYRMCWQIPQKPFKEYVNSLNA